MSLQSGRIAAQRQSWCFDTAVAPSISSEARNSRQLLPGGVAGGRKKKRIPLGGYGTIDDLLCPFSGKVCVLKSVDISNSSSHNSASKQRTRSNTAATAASFRFLHPINRSSSSCRLFLRPIKILRHQRLWALSPASSSASVSSIVLTNILFILAIVVPFPTCCSSSLMSLSSKIIPGQSTPQHHHRPPRPACHPPRSPRPPHSAWASTTLPSVSLDDGAFRTLKGACGCEATTADWLDVVRGLTSPLFVLCGTAVVDAAMRHSTGLQIGGMRS